MRLTAQNDMNKVIGSHTPYEVYNKKRKARIERRKANKNPLVAPTYGKYKGWVS